MKEMKRWLLIMYSKAFFQSCQKLWRCHHQLCSPTPIRNGEGVIQNSGVKRLTKECCCGSASKFLNWQFFNHFWALVLLVPKLRWGCNKFDDGPTIQLQRSIKNAASLPSVLESSLSASYHVEFIIDQFERSMSSYSHCHAPLIGRWITGENSTVIVIALLG